MEKIRIKELIDKSVYEELDHEEKKHISDAIQQDSDLATYYYQQQQLSEDLRSIADENFFPNSDLEQAREELFSSIQDEKKTFSYTQMGLVASITVLLTSSFFLFFQSKSKARLDQVVSYQFEGLDEDQIEIRGKQLQDFKLKVKTSDERIQKLLKKTVLNESNINKKLVAMEYLNQNKAKEKAEFKDFIAHVIQKEESVPLKLEALRTVENLPIDKQLEEIYLGLLQSEQNKVIQMKIIEQLLKNTNETQRKKIIQDLMGKRSK